ncbi:MAG: methyltransferase domain-containing protein [FCB group bacterium]|jgi:ubiquinone/menaquinone biosynthesis C-methylase UbiE|nr:methyltransferase domain-containing protein [FCB group bacterium]
MAGFVPCSLLDRTANCTAMRRIREPELMDDPNADPRTHRSALAALRRSNRWLGFDAALVKAVGAIAPFRGASILEIGSGGGGLIEALAGASKATEVEGRSPSRTVETTVARGAPVFVRSGEAAKLGSAKWNTRARRPVDEQVRSQGRLRLIGMDRSRPAIADARGHLAKTAIEGADGELSFVAGDALRLPFADRSVDVAVCSLLLHHFDPGQAVGLLREAARVARHAVVIGDLNRSAVAWVLTWVVTRLMSRSRYFHVDGPRSVRAAYRPAEAGGLAEEAGLAGATVVPVFPFRWMMVWRREAP